MTYGKDAVGLNFNPSQDPDVHRIKAAFADIIDSLYDARNETHDGEKKRLYSVAITEAQTAQMWAVKAVTWQISKVPLG